MDPLISIIIPNMNGMEHLPDCLTSLAAATYPRDRQEWIVSDNGSRDGSPDWVRQAYPQVRIVENGSNIGFARGCNAGAREARGEYLVFLNNDTRVAPGWLQGYLRALAPDPTAVCAASYMRSWDDQEVDFDGASCNLFGVGRPRAVAGWPDCPAGLQAGDPLLFACGGAMLIRRAVFLEVGGFDPTFFIYFEDVDLGWRLWVLGYRVVFAPESVVYHKEGGTTGARRAPSHRRYLLFEANTLSAIVKNYEQPNLDRVLPAALLLEWQRALLSAGAAIDPAHYRLDGPRGPLDDGRSAALPPLSLAHLLALRRLNERWPQLLAERARIQARRRRPDSEILALFGRPFQPQFAGARYADTMRQIAAALDLYPLVATAAPSRILLLAPATGLDGRRATALATLLAPEFRVVRHAGDGAGLAPTADLLLAAGATIPAAAALAPAVPLAADVGAGLPDAVPADRRATLAQRAGLLICATDAGAEAWRAALPGIAIVVQPETGPLAADLRHYCRYPLHHG
ncbi:MAG TPA: glycosyltransferase family 2 protein [Chloroflexia bacterium]|nr:glycosyltransferase family 2 protein [Chloroflexia bacterium]